jgi:hypothetical protein
MARFITEWDKGSEICRSCFEHVERLFAMGSQFFLHAESLRGSKSWLLPYALMVVSTIPARR